MLSSFFPDFQRFNPFRRVDWRWQRAQWLLSHGQNFSRRLDDEPTRQVLSYLRTLANKQRASIVAKRHPTIHAAWLCYESDGPTRLLLEAHFLARRTTDEIAQLTGVPAKVIDTFEAIFFECREYLHATDWIMARVIGTTWWHGFAGIPVGALWKYFAYHYGPVALDIMIAVTTDGPFPAYIDNALTVNPAYQASHLRLAGKLLVQAMTTDSPEVLSELVRVHTEMKRIDRKERGTVDNSSNPFNIMKNLLKSQLSRSKPRRKNSCRKLKDENGAADTDGVITPGLNTVNASFLHDLR